jgi:pyridoxamine 5'-phosphate oxidase
VNPEVQFAEWFEQATALEGEGAARCFLATSTPTGQPSVRVVFHRPGASARVRFFTNYESRKGNELSANPWAAAAFHWPSLNRQVRLEGVCERVAEADSDAYFSGRPRESQLAAQLSPQSRAIESVDGLRAQHRVASERLTEAPLARPAHWGGYELAPTRMEFWTAGHARLHERMLWRLESGVWQRECLAP